MIVIDTSALVDYLVGSTPVSDQIRDVVTDEPLGAPAGVDLECLSVLRGLVIGRKLMESEADRAVELLAQLRLRRYPHAPLLGRIWELKHNAWPYDAAYVALAETLDAPLLTIDSKIERIPGIRCTVINPAAPQ